MRHGKALLGDKVRYTVEMLISAVPSQSPCGRQLPPRGASQLGAQVRVIRQRGRQLPPRGASHVLLLTLNLNLLRKEQ